MERRRVLSGLAGIVLGLGTAALVGCSKNKEKSYQDAPLKSYAPETRVEAETQESEEWGTVIEFDSFTYRSREKLTREEVEERLKNMAPCNHDEDTNYLNYGLPALHRREQIKQGDYKGKFIGLNHLSSPNATIVTVMERKDIGRRDDAQKLLQVKRYEDGSDEILFERGILYNYGQVTDLIKDYPVKIDIK